MHYQFPFSRSKILAVTPVSLAGCTHAFTSLTDSDPALLHCDLLKSGQSHSPATLLKLLLGQPAHICCSLSLPLFKPPVFSYTSLDRPFAVLMQDLPTFSVWITCCQPRLFRTYSSRRIPDKPLSLSVSDFEFSFCPHFFLFASSNGCRPRCKYFVLLSASFE